MPAWLAAWLGVLLAPVIKNLVKPLIEDAIAKLQFDSRMKEVTERQNQMIEGVSKLIAADTEEERDAADKIISKSLNP